MKHLIDNIHLRKVGDWSAIWKLGIPQKVKLLIWRTVRGVLLVRPNLRKKRVNDEACCPLCSSSDETPRHIFRVFKIEAEYVLMPSGIFNKFHHIRDDLETLKECLFKWLTKISQPHKICLQCCFGKQRELQMI